MSLSVNYLVFCVPTLHINNYRNRDIVLNTLITEFITLGVKHHMAGKVPKSKDFYKVSLCSNTIVSTWKLWGKRSTGCIFLASNVPSSSKRAISRASVAGSHET